MSNSRVSKSQRSQEKHIKISKAAQELITKFHYYQLHYGCQNASRTSEKNKEKDGNFFIDQHEEEMQSLSIMFKLIECPRNELQTEDSISTQGMVDIVKQSLIANYCQNGVKRVGQSYIKETFIQTTSNMLQPFTRKAFAGQILQIVQYPTIVMQKKQSQTNQTVFFVCHHMNNQSQIQQQNSFLNFRSKTLKIQWNNFIEKYTFGKRKIRHQLIVTAKKDGDYQKNRNLLRQLLGLYSSKKFLSEFIKTYEQTKAKWLKQLTLKQISLKNEDPAFSQTHRRIHKLPGQYYLQFQALRKEFKAYNITENDICRFFYANNYSFKATKSVIYQYINMICILKRDHDPQSYRKFIQLKFMQIIGDDRAGRPILLISLEKWKANQFDVDQFINNMRYFVEIQLISKRRGFVDTHIQINDFKDFNITQNISISIINKYLKSELKKFLAQRPFIIYGINLNTFAYGWYRTIKSFIPERTLRKVRILGTDKQQIRKDFITVMDQSVIPQHLGGSANQKNRQLMKLI